MALQALGLSLGGVASSAAMADSTYFKYSNAYYSNATARQKMTIYTRGTPDKTSDSTYSGACTYSYGANSDPAMNEGESGKTSTTFSQYLTTTERDYRFNNNSEFLLGAFVDYIAPSVPLPLYSSVPHFCETTPADSTRDKTTIGNILYNNVRTGAFLRLRSLDDSENIFNFEFAQTGSTWKPRVKIGGKTLWAGRNISILTLQRLGHSMGRMPHWHLRTAKSPFFLPKPQLANISTFI